MYAKYSETRKKYPLSFLKPVKKTILMSYGFVMSLFFVLVLINGICLWSKCPATESVSLSVLIIIITIIIVSLCFLYHLYYYLTYFYDLTSDYIIIRKGTYANKEINIPYEHINDIYVDQDALDKILGLHDVHISSATDTSLGFAHIDGVGEAAANGLKNDLMQKIEENQKSS